jgi:hypothetical protein
LARIITLPVLFYCPVTIVLFYCPVTIVLFYCPGDYRIILLPR